MEEKGWGEPDVVAMVTDWITQWGIMTRKLVLAGSNKFLFL